MNVAKDWGAEQNAWVVTLSFVTAATLGTIVVVGALILFRVQVLRLLLGPLQRPLAFLFAWLGVLISFTPLRHPLRRYLYVGQHLAEA